MDPERTSPAIEMRGVTVGAMRDSNTIVAENVNWTVQSGEFWVIGGLQGSGKSDFLMTAGGMVAPVAGSYCFFGEEMPIFDEHRLRERLRLGFVFDGGQLFNHLTIAENVALPLRYHRNLSQPAADADVRQMLELTELGPWADSTPGALPRNWRKRAGLARALMLRPDVLLLDNPLTGLDLRHRAWWLSFLNALWKGHDWMNGRSMTLVIAADNLRPWQNRSCHFAILRDRKFSVVGPRDRLEMANAELTHELLAMAQHDL